MNRLLELAFDHQDACRAAEQWGCNCGPAALAAVLGISLDAVRPYVERSGFDLKRYMSPTMMNDALSLAGANKREMTKSRKVSANLFPDVLPVHGLVRIQWTGPWTAPGANPCWAYSQTHWIATFDGFVFDINYGLSCFGSWLRTVPPQITASIPRADGGWYATHLWEVEAR